MRRIASFVLLALVAAACGGASDAGDDGAGDIAHPTKGSELVLRVETLGGFLPANETFRMIPEFSLYGDGLILRPGAQIEIFPPPAMPAVQATRVTKEGLQAILQAAANAGLMGKDAELPLPGGVAVADAGTTIFTLVAEGKKHEIKAPALGTMPEAGARGALQRFRERLGDLASWLPKGAVGEDKVYEPTGLKVVVVPPQSAQPVDPPQAARNWSIAGQLAGFKQPVGAAGYRCGIVTGGDLPKVLPSVQTSNTLTPWIDGGARHQIIVRPLLPEENAC